MSGSGSSTPKGTRTYVPSNLRRVTLPTTDKPLRWDPEGYELDESGQRRTAMAQGAGGKQVAQDPKPLLSIEESLVLLQSLQQTRQHHIQELFPIFTTPQTSRSKAQPKAQGEEIGVPRHDVKLIGKCTLTVGPTSFQNVSLWECRFLEYQHPVRTPAAQLSSSNPIDQAQVAATASSRLVPSVITSIEAMSKDLPWVKQLLTSCGEGKVRQDLKLLSNLIDHLAAGLTLPPPKPNGDPPDIPPVPRHMSLIRPQKTGQCWRISKDKAPLLLLSFDENPSTKFLVPVQLSVIAYSRSKAATTRSPIPTPHQQIPQDENDIMSISMFLPCRGWGKWENAPDLTRTYRTITTRRKQGNDYPDSSSGHKMLRPLPADPKSDFGPIGGISIPAGMLEPVTVTLSGLAPNTYARVRGLAREIENFDNQGEAEVTLSSRGGVQNAEIHGRATPSTSTKSSVGGRALPIDLNASSSRDPSIRSSATVREADRVSQSERRSRRSETRGLDEGRTSSTPPAGAAMDRPLGDKPWKVQLFERLLKRVPKRAFLQCRVASPVPPEIVNAAMANNPSMTARADITQKEGNGKNPHNASPGSSTRKRKAPEPETTNDLEMTITLDSLEESILRRTAEPLVIDDTLRQQKRIHKPAFDNTSPCQGCGMVGVKIWRIGPNGRATLCDKCGDKVKQGTLGERVAPNATPTSTPAVNAARILDAGQVARPPTIDQQSLPVAVQDQTQPRPLNSSAPALDRPSASPAPNQPAPSVLQPGPPAGSGLVSLPGSRSGQEAPVASTSRTPSLSRLLSQGSPVNSIDVQAKLPSETVEHQDQEMRYVPGPADSRTSRLAGPDPSLNLVTPQVGQLPFPWAASDGLDTGVGRPGHLYHEPQRTSGYIPPRKILPSAISHSPTMAVRQTSLPNSQHTALNTKTPPHVGEGLLTSTLRPASAPATSLPATNTDGSSVGDSGTAKAFATPTEVPAPTVLTTESANPMSDVRYGDPPLDALVTIGSKAHPSVLESRTTSPHTADPSILNGK